MWAAEEIPDDGILYQRVHRNNLDDKGAPIPGAFRNTPTKQDGMSTDWEKYSTPAETRARARSPAANSIIALAVGKVREIEAQTVEHTPVNPAPTILPNRAHADVFGEKTTEARLKFLQIYTPVSEIELCH